jgi:hypothetical protein
MVDSVAFATVLTAAVIASFGTSARAADALSGSLVGGLVDMSDMRPLLAMDAPSKSAGRSRSTGSQAFTRQSVPDRDRAASYRTDELFGHSKVALPLLVVDLEPQQVGSDIRPMSGRSVGARPAAAWTRPLIRPLGESVGPTRQSATSWSAYGQR